jgi:hypothetical protein
MKNGIALVMAVLGLVSAGCAAKSTTVLSPAKRPDASPSTAATTTTKTTTTTTGAGRETTSSSTTSTEGTVPATTRGLLAPSTTGSITSTIGANNNLALKVKLEHLPPPSNLDSTLTTYVVWIRPRTGGAYQNVGQLVMGTDRAGELTTTTAFTDVDVVVTAERDPTTLEPSKFMILQGAASRP